MKSQLDTCLSTGKDLASSNWEAGYQDSWPVERF
jgi:hypothetical protein